MARPARRFIDQPMHHLRAEALAPQRRIDEQLLENRMV
jgi:hypothetical protein